MDDTTFRDILDAVRTVVRREVVPREEELDRTGTVPEELRQLARDLGLFGYALPEEHGGLGLSPTQDVQLAFELGWTTPSFRSIFGTNNSIAGQMIARYGTEEQRQRYLPALCGGAVAAFALTEPEAGSAPADLTTSARRDGDHWVIDGSKRFITNAPHADVIVTFARTGPDGERGPRISAFLVDPVSPGLQVGAPDAKMGQAASTTADVVYSAVEVPDADLLGGEDGDGQAYRWALSVLSRGRLHIAGVAVGAAERLIDEMVAYANTRRQGGRAIGEYQLVQAMIADSITGAQAGRALVLDVARDLEDGGDGIRGPAVAKLFCSEMVDRVADHAVQVHGGSGYMRGVAVERFYRDVRLFRIYEGTSQILQLVIARDALKDHQLA